MDLPVYLAMGLATTGYLNSDKKKAKKNGNANGQMNIYNNASYDRVERAEFNVVNRAVNKGFESGIVPYFFNAISESSAKKIKNPNYDSELFKAEITKIYPNLKLTVSHVNPQAVDNNILKAGDDMVTGTYAMNDPSDKYGKLLTKAQTAPEIAKTHSNMVPYFGGSVKQNTYDTNIQQDQKLEAFTGQFKLDQNHKKENTNLFSPVQQDIFSTEFPRELDRYSTDLTYRNNELPFEQTYVGRGLNDGYTATPSGGFHNDVRALPKNIDQLLVNPRQSYKNKIIKGKHMVNKRVAEQQSFKYTPDSTIMNLNGERNFVTTGASLAQTARAEIIMKDTNRKNNVFISGVATAVNSHKPSNRQDITQNNDNTLYGVLLGAIQAVGKKFTTESESKVVIRTDRGKTQVVKQGNAVGNIKQMQYNTDPTKKLKAESYNSLETIDKIINGCQTNGAYVYDPNQLTKTTGRQVIENNTNNGNINACETNGTYVYDPNQLTKTTGRQVIENNTNNGNINGCETNGTYVYDPNQLTKTTGRQVIENNTNSGNINGVETNGTYVYNPNQLTKITGRQVIENNTNNGNINGVEKNGTYVYDPNQLTKTTGRQVIENNTNNGNINGVEKNGTYVYDPYDFTKETGRQLIENNENAGYITGQVGTGDGYRTAPTNINETQRENYSDSSYNGPANNTGTGEMLYNSAYSMRQNIINEVLSTNRESNKEGAKIFSNNIGQLTSSHNDNLVNRTSAPVRTNKTQERPTNMHELTSIKNLSTVQNKFFTPEIYTSQINSNALQAPLRIN